jgi:hypothetical protein
MLRPGGCILLIFPIKGDCFVFMGLLVDVIVLSGVYTLEEMLVKGVLVE